MDAVIVYESLWGNTAAVARAVAEGFGPGARALTTDEATPAVIHGADVVVVGAPVIAFGLASDKTREGIGHGDEDAGNPPDVAHPSLKSWLDSLPAGRGSAAAFETRLWWSPRGATGVIERGLRKAGYEIVGKAEKFVVDGKYGPLREGELDRARGWGRSLAERAGATVEAA
ncbi:MAG: flavodoxin [Chloroflexota bacterium]